MKLRQVQKGDCSIKKQPAGTAVAIENPRLLGAVCGSNDRNLEEISSLLSVPVRTRGNQILLESADGEAVRLFRGLLGRMTQIAGRDDSVSIGQIRSLFSDLESNEEDFPENTLKVGSQRIFPRSRAQAGYISQMNTKDLVFSIGPAGTGKTYLAVACALMQLVSRSKRKIVLTRPVVETGESLGFLPGDLTQKLAPYLRPLYDAMEELLNPERLERLKNSGQIEVAPLAYMRGRSLKNCCIVLDEAQNTTKRQMKMFLTRLGEGSRAIVTGDLTQTDLPSPEESGLRDAVRILRGIDDIAITEFTSSDVVRHPLIRKIIDAYEKRR